MKNFTRSLLIASLLILTSVITTNAQAVTDSSHTATTTQSNYHENEDHGNWGLLGLVGLIGLAGLGKRGPVERKVEYRDNQVR